MSDKVKTRSEVDPRDTWATEDIFQSDEAWEEAYKKAQKIPEKTASYQG